jgi:rfaE bifunctional protein kinase chain/domain
VSGASVAAPVDPRARGMSALRAKEIVDRFADTSVLVVGDLMVDQFVVGQVERISPEAPVPVVRFAREDRRVGGAGNVAQNVRAVGARAEMIGVVGADADGARLVGDLQAAGIGVSGVESADGRCTTRKMRIVTVRNQHVARVDYEADGDVPADLQEHMAAAAERLATSCHAIVVSDYLKGVVTSRVMDALVSIARARRIPLLVDPKVPHLNRYRGATLITPNHHEAEAATHIRVRSDADARQAALAFRAAAGSDGVLVTRGEQGMWLLAGDVEASLPAVAREVSDVTGAGDTVIAMVALALAAGASPVEAAAIANHAAGIVVGKFGPATVTSSELMAVLAGVSSNYV